ncbi:SPOR domain-containing protein [Bartonella gliris]|uniref:SPOR domain-containing protein n=1 Tax=Bartonella gliris TaxID=3004109 RepID=UPI00295E49C6|nr:SPOR domain-containing protein [Bartonella gliris]
MSDNDRKNPHEIKQDHEHHDPLERLTRIFNPNKQSKNQSDQSFLRPDQSISQPLKTSFHDDDFDLSFLEAELENNLKNSLPFDDQKKQWNLQEANNERTSSIAPTDAFNHSEQKSFLSEEVYSSPISNDEEQILDALSPLPIQKNQLPQNETAPTSANPFFEKSNSSAEGHFSAQSESFFFDESDIDNNNRVATESTHQATRFSQTTTQQSNNTNIYDDNQSLNDTAINHPYKVSADQENWAEEYYANVSNPSTVANTGFSSVDLISGRESTAKNESTNDFPFPLDSTQIEKSSDLKSFPQEGYTTDYPQFYEEELSEKEVYAAKNSEYGDAQTQYQYINNAENISEQKNQEEVPCSPNTLNEMHSSSEILSKTQTGSFFAYHTTHRDTPPPNIDTYKFAEEIVEKTGPIMVPEVPYEVPEYDVPTDGLKEEFADVLNVGNVPAEDFSRQQQQNNEVLNQIFHQTMQNPREDAYRNSQEQSTDYFSTDNMRYNSSPVTENSSYRAVDEFPQNASTTSPLKSFIFGKALTKSVMLLILIGIGLIGYSRFFMPSQKNGSTPIIRADNTPFKFKEESTETKNDAAHNLDIYKQTTEQNEKQENTQEFLIDTSEPPEDLAALSQQESTNISPSSLDESDVEDAVAEAINHTIPTQEVQTVIVKQDGSVVLAPAHHTDKKTTDEPEETIDQATVNQLQDDSSTPSQFSDTNSKETEDNLTADIDKIILENTSIPDLKKNTKNSSIPIPSREKFNSDAQTHIASRPNSSTQVITQNYYVQLASQPTHALAKDSLKKMQSRFGFLIGARPLNIQSALIPGKGTYYRVRIQTQNRNEAINLCEDIKNSGGSCFITR